MTNNVINFIKSDWMIPIGIFGGLMALFIPLVYVDVTATQNLINSFSCADFKEFLLNQESHSFWVENQYVERCS